MRSFQSQNLFYLTSQSVQVLYKNHLILWTYKLKSLVEKYFPFFVYSAFLSLSTNWLTSFWYILTHKKLKVTSKMSNLLASQVLLENTFIWLQNLVKMTKKNCEIRMWRVCCQKLYCLKLSKYNCSPVCVCVIAKFYKGHNIQNYRNTINFMWPLCTLS